MARLHRFLQSLRRTSRLNRAARLARSRALATSQTPDRPAKPKHKLLLVESPGQESPRLREQAARAGFNVQSSHGGRMAHAAVKRTQPDLVLLAPQPGPPGASEIARLIKEDPETKDIPVVILIEGAHLEQIFTRVYPTEACLSIDASESEFRTTLRALAGSQRRLRPKTSPGAPLEGNLEDDVLPDLLQFLVTSRKRGRVTVTSGIVRGSIYIDDGFVIHAEQGALWGLEAFQAMCFSRQGTFSFQPDAVAPRRTMKAAGIELLLESARRQDTAARAMAERRRELSPE